VARAAWYNRRKKEEERVLVDKERILDDLLVTSVYQRILEDPSAIIVHNVGSSSIFQ
jgi:hypothetical protein